MLKRDLQDIVGGLAMMAIGLFVAWYAYHAYDMGRLARMGPGFFPVSLGVILATIGLFITIPAFLRPGSPIKVEVRNLVCITLGVVVFALLMRTLGIVLASVASALIASLADRSVSWKGRVLISLGIAFVTWLIFIVGLGMSIPVWPQELLRAYT